MYTYRYYTYRLNTAVRLDAVPKPARIPKYLVYYTNIILYIHRKRSRSAHKLRWNKRLANKRLYMYPYRCMYVCNICIPEAMKQSQRSFQPLIPLIRDQTLLSSPDQWTHLRYTLHNHSLTFWPTSVLVRTLTVWPLVDVLKSQYYCASHCKSAREKVRSNVKKDLLPPFEYLYYILFIRSHSSAILLLLFLSSVL